MNLARSVAVLAEGEPPAELPDQRRDHPHAEAGGCSRVVSSGQPRALVRDRQCVLARGGTFERDLDAARAVLGGVGHEFGHNQPEGNDLGGRERGIDDLNTDRALVGPQRAGEIIAQPREVGTAVDSAVVFSDVKMLMYPRDCRHPAGGQGQLRGRLRIPERVPLQPQQAGGQLQAVHHPMVGLLSHQFGPRRAASFSSTARDRSATARWLTGEAPSGP